MIKRQELVSYLDTFLDAEAFADYGPNGLQVEGKEEIQTVVTAVSATRETIERAIEAKADALLVHHGLFWSRDPYPLVGWKKERICLLLEHNINLLAYHLPLDAHPTVGNNFRAATDLGWENLEPFNVGVRATFSPRPIDTFVKQVETYYSHPAHAALGGPSTVSSAILISGGAYKELASLPPVDCFLTGNFDEPAWPLAHERNIHFLALGHTPTENIGPHALATHLAEHLSLTTKFLKINNPF